MDSGYNDLLISIVVPIFNVEGYVERCITSIIEQTYENIEIILVDDGSTDRSGVICDGFAEQDRRIRVIHKKNGGLVSTRKAGINIAMGEYVLYVDGDDWIEKDRILHIVKQIANHKSDMIYMSGYKYDIDEKSTIKDDMLEPKIYIGNKIQEELFPLVQSLDKCFECNIRGSLSLWCMRRSFLKKKQNLVDNRISMCEDQICVWFCLLSANSVAIMKEQGYHYVQRSNSLSYSFNPQESMKMHIWYQQLREYINNYNNSGSIIERFVFFTARVLLLSDYEMVILDGNHYLFPYSKVVRNSKVIVYGAGKLGHQMVRVIDKKKDWKLVLWVDENTKREGALGYRISQIEDILQAEYDFVIIAAIYENMSLEMKQNLLLMGISEDKIAMMDPAVITKEYIEEIFRGGGNIL